jgi:hypothetical protein
MPLATFRRKDQLGEIVIDSPPLFQVLFLTQKAENGTLTSDYDKASEFCFSRRQSAPRSRRRT